MLNNFDTFIKNKHFDENDNYYIHIVDDSENNFIKKRATIVLIGKTYVILKDDKSNFYIATNFRYKYEMDFYFFKNIFVTKSISDTVLHLISLEKIIEY